MEYQYKNVLFEYIPHNLNVKSATTLDVMEAINILYTNNPEIVGGYYRTRTIKGQEILVIPIWDKLLEIQIRGFLENHNRYIVEDILFTGVKFELDSSKKLKLTTISDSYISRILKAYSENPLKFKNSYPIYNYKEKNYLHIPCETIDFNKLGISKNAQTLSNKPILEVKGNERNNKNNQRIKLDNNRENKYLEVPYELPVEQSKSDLDFDFELKNEESNKTIDKKEVENTEHVERVDFLIKQHSIVNETLPTKLPEQDIKREPIGSMRPRVLEKTQHYKVKKSKSISIKTGNENPVKVTRSVKTTIRDHKLVAQLKKLYNHTCQLCGRRVEIAYNEFATEVHHIQPLGGEHNGPDIKENMVVLCHIDHAMFDNGAITIDLSDLTIKHVNPSNPIHNTKLVLKHRIDEKYINYHNKIIFIKY
ncbi:HNH endonuclease [Bacillus sp. JJ664]